jgi:hypothetical protein
MTDSLIIEKAIDEVETKTFGLTKQFLEIHKLAYVDNKPKIARVDTDKKDEAIVYFNVEGEKFFLAVYIDTTPITSVRWTNTEAYHSVYLRASSTKYTLSELAELTKLKSTREKTKRERNTIDFEPNPEADEFGDKLNKLLDYMERDKEGIEQLIKKADYCYIQVYSSFHNGNTLIGGHHIDKDQIKRISNLNLDIDFDISADGNFFV